MIASKKNPIPRNNLKKGCEWPVNGLLQTTEK
jgi:hypothetical protein